jgi:hypothetical protein
MSGTLTVMHTVNVARQVCRHQVEKFIPHKPSEIRNRTCAVIVATNRKRRPTPPVTLLTDSAPDRLAVSSRERLHPRSPAVHRYPRLPAKCCPTDL